MVKKRCIFLDRDGVINKSIVLRGKPFAPLKIKDFLIFKYARKSIKLLKNFFLVIVITNQPDVQNKRLSLRKLKKMNSILKTKTQVDDIYFCPHSKYFNCDCRKPKTKLFKLAAKKYNLDLKKSYMIGDRKIDIDAGKNIKCTTIYIKKNYNEKKPTNYDFQFKNLYQASKFIIRNEKN